MNLPADCLKSVVLGGSVPFDLSFFSVDRVLGWCFGRYVGLVPFGLELGLGLGPATVRR